MKLYPHATSDGIIQLVELAELEKVKLAAIGLEAECAGLRGDVQELNDLFTEAVKRMEAVPCPPSAFTGAQWGFAKKQFISAAYESAKSGNLPDPPLFEYRGKMYMRPCDRGVVLEDIDKQFDNDVLPEGDFVCEIRVWKGEQQ